MATIITKGIDVSQHNGKIDWAKVKAAGIDFAIVRAGFGWSMGNKDPCFDYNVQQAQKNGIDVGAYWFAYGYTPALAKAEAETFIKVCQAYKLTYPLFYDLEYDSVRYAAEHGVTITKQLATALADTFLSTLQKAGYYVGNYANDDYLVNYFTPALTAKYDLWHARWGKEDTARQKSMWQYEVRGSAAAVQRKEATVVGNVSGIPGCIDMNYCYVDYPEIIRKAGMNHLTGAAAVPEKPQMTPGAAAQTGYTGKFKVGDIVQYTGDTHYYSANSTNALKCIGGKAKVTAVYPAGKHPYSLVREAGSGATVYGWVDENDISAYKAESAGIKSGSTVRLNKGATDYYGTRLASFVYNRNHIVRSVDGDKAVITYGGVVVAAVRISDLTKIN